MCHAKWCHHGNTGLLMDIFISMSSSLPWPPVGSISAVDHGTHIHTHTSSVFYTSSHLAIETARVLERSFKESRAIDTESLCIIAGAKVGTNALTCILILWTLCCRYGQ